MYHKWQSYDVWFLRYWAQQTECFVILGYFLLFYSPKNLSTKNENHMMYDFGDMEHNRQNFYHFGLSFAHHKIYGSWDMKCNRQNIFVILGHFLPFYPPNSPKNWKYQKIEKNSYRYHHDHMLYCSWDMVCDKCNYYLSFWAIFCPFTPITAQKINISKKWKNSWRYHHFTQVCRCRWCPIQDDVQFLRYDAQRTDRETDGWMDRWTDKKVTYKGGCPN